MKELVLAGADPWVTCSVPRPAGAADEAPAAAALPRAFEIAAEEQEERTSPKHMAAAAAGDDAVSGPMDSPAESSAKNKKKAKKKAGGGSAAACSAVDTPMHAAVRLRCSAGLMDALLSSVQAQLQEVCREQRCTTCDSLPCTLLYTAQGCSLLAHSCLPPPTSYTLLALCQLVVRYAAVVWKASRLTFAMRAPTHSDTPCVPWVCPGVPCPAGWPPSCYCPGPGLHPGQFLSQCTHGCSDACERGGGELSHAGRRFTYGLGACRCWCCRCSCCCLTFTNSS